MKIWDWFKDVWQPKVIRKESYTKVTRTYDANGKLLKTEVETKGNIPKDIEDEQIDKFFKKMDDAFKEMKI